eukprot:5265983-Amphidinium_carterae.1
MHPMDNVLGHAHLHRVKLTGQSRIDPIKRSTDLKDKHHPRKHPTVPAHLGILVFGDLAQDSTRFVVKEALRSMILFCQSNKNERQRQSKPVPRCR